MVELENLPISLPMSRKRGIFKVAQEDKKALELIRKKKMLNRKLNRIMQLKKLLEEEERKGHKIKERIQELEKDLQNEKAQTMIPGQSLEEQK